MAWLYQYGDTPLHDAASKGYHSVCSLLLQNGANMEMRNKDGDTPLHDAASRGHHSVCSLLLQNGANIEMRNKDNNTPLDMAKNGRHDRVVQLFKSYPQKKLQRKKEIMASLQKSLNKAKNQHGKISVRFIKILLTGSGAAGKTSFCNLLMKKQFNVKHHSTNLIHNKHAISVKKAIMVGSKLTYDQGVTWLEMDDSTQISHLRQVLLQSNIYKEQRTVTKNESSQVKSAKSTTAGTRLSGATSASKAAQPVADSSQSSIGEWFTGLFQTSVKSEKLTSFSTLVENTITTPTTSLTYQPGEVLNIITILDTGGQPEYIHLLPTVNINPVITFIVHDLSRGLDEQVLVEYSEHGKHTFEPYHLQYSNLDMIKFLMSSTNDALERPLSQVPQLVTVPGKDTTSYLCCVGTHADKVASKIVHKINRKLTNMVEKLDCKAAVWQNKDGSVLFPVNNTTSGSNDAEDPIATLIRSEIEMLSSKKDVYELPITWMLLEFEIRQVCTERGKPYISFQECVSIALKSKLISDVEQVRSALLYHHLLGVLLYYPEVPGLCDYIITDHQWLFDKLSQVVCFTFKRSLSTELATNKLKHSGILSKKLLQMLQWEDELKQEYFIFLLCIMKIIAPLPREDGDGEDYFIPYVLPTFTSQPTDDILSQYGCLQGEPLLIQFISNLLPRGFFCCLIVEILQHLPSGWDHLITQEDACHAYSNLITFNLPHAYFLSLMDKFSYLEVQLRHKEEHYYKKCPIHLSVQDVLASALGSICEQLNFSQGRLQYGFHCQCGKSDDKHIAVLTSLIPPFDYARCSHGSLTSIKLQHSHIIWLVQEKHDSAENTVIKSKAAEGNLNESPNVVFQEDPLADKTPDQPVIKRPAMRLLHEVVIPRIAADWSLVADYLEYEVEDKKVIQKKHHNDPIECCVELLENWLSSNKGVSPKSWSKLIEVLGQIKSLTSTTEKIIEDLAKAGVFV
ncbi:uncharacterized protein [Dysidea avara]|uniref:uncharacterized protein isoform X3 n=1 Tax=Dysidea avara TaxID=196820 RepID=UPI0033301D49